MMQGCTIGPAMEPITLGIILGMSLRGLVPIRHIESEFVHCIQCNNLHDGWFSGGGGNGTTMGRSVPTGWDVRWMNSTLHNMSAGEVERVLFESVCPTVKLPGITDSYSPPVLPLVTSVFRKQSLSV